MRMISFLKKSFDYFPDKIAIYEAENVWRYQDIYEMTNTVANVIYSTQVRKNDRICICFTNVVEFIFSYFAVLKVGCIPVLVSVNTPVDKIYHILQETSAVGFVGHSWVFRLISDTKKTLQFAILDKYFHTKRNDFKIFFIDQLKPDPEFSGVEYNEPEKICLYTSGSTGKPKGVVLTSSNIDYSTSTIINYLKLNEKDCTLVSMPFSHCAGLLYMLVHVRIAGSLITGESASMPGSFLTAIYNKGVTNLPVIPSLMNLYVKNFKKEIAHYCSKLKYIELSSEPYNQLLINTLTDILPTVKLFNTYGLTEAPRATYHNVKKDSNAIISVGKPNSQVNITIINSQNKPCQAGETGELFISGPNVAHGYWNKPETTNKVFTKLGFKTGDMGYKDHLGRIFLTKRVDEMIKIGGENVYPDEIRQVINSISGVENVQIHTVDDAIYGKAIHVYVKRHTEAITEKHLLKYCRKYLEKNKIPTMIEFL